jgi:hypothetical protein
MQVHRLLPEYSAAIIVAHTSRGRVPRSVATGSPSIICIDTSGGRRGYASVFARRNRDHAVDVVLSGKVHCKRAALAVSRNEHFLRTLAARRGQPLRRAPPGFE